MDNGFIEIVGYLAAICTTIAFMPQVVQTWRSKQAYDISLPMYLLFTVGISMWLFYGLSIGSWPITAANSITLVLAIAMVAMKLLYGMKR